MTTPLDWYTGNQQDLVRALERVRLLLVGRVEAGAAVHADVPALAPPADEEPDTPEFALAALVALFGLSSFERDVLLLCAGVELDWRFGPLVGSANGDPGRQAPTFGLAMAVLPEAHWSALTPGAPLRAWHLVEVAGPGVATAPLRIDERILHFLAGIDQLDERLRGLVGATPVAAEVATPSQASVAERVAATLAVASAPAAVQLVGGDRDTRLAIAGMVARRDDRSLVRIHAADVPAMATDRYALARLISREALLERAIVLIECDGAEGIVVSPFVDRLLAPVIVSVAEPLRLMGGTAPVVEISPPVPTERLAAWRAALGPGLTGRLNGSLAPLAAQFVLGPSSLRVVAARTAPLAEHGSPLEVERAVWDACRIEARPRLDGLAQRIEAVATWDDLVLPDGQVRTLHAIASQVRQRHRVYDHWGFATKGTRGLGISALFAGPSGTGKTMAAEVLARELELDVYRIDLATVVSKYIGETEKNLKRLFDAAEAGGAILLFDEADALFGKRSDVKDSHDRYANIEVSYLLQRMEAYRGLAILTTNMKTALDAAFLRRIRFIIHFPFPDATQRARIWRGIFPDPTPTATLDYERLAQLDVAGGHIRNIALGGAFLAADRSESVSMAHLAEAAQVEYAKLERPLSDAEFRGWS